MVARRGQSAANPRRARVCERTRAAFEHTCKAGMLVGGCGVRWRALIPVAGAGAGSGGGGVGGARGAAAVGVVREGGQWTAWRQLFCRCGVLTILVGASFVKEQKVWVSNLIARK